MRKTKNELMDEIHEIRLLMEYLDSSSNPIDEDNTVSTQGLKAGANDVKKDMSGGLANQYEKTAVDALLGMVKKLQAKGSQLTPKIKKYLQLLNAEFEGASNMGMVKEINESARKDINKVYLIEGLVKKISKENNLTEQEVGIMIAEIAINMGRKN